MYTILLIEDEFDVASMLRLLLSRHGHRALLAYNLVEASHIWGAYKNEIDLVLTDNHLPDGSGIAFAEHLVREKPSLKVIVSSGYPADTLPSGFHRADKPFESSTLMETIRRAVGEQGGNSARL
jgi:two-component system, NtrC family, response regulator HydG